MTKMSGTFLNSGACDAGPQGEGKESPSNAGRLQTTGRDKYQPYPDYKYSGVEWLGEIPDAWELWKLAHAYDVIGSGTTPPTNEDKWFGDGVPWVTTGELREKAVEQTTKNVTFEALNQFSALKIHPAGSVVIAMYGATIGRLGVLGINATTNQACCVLTQSQHLYNQYVFYWLYAFRDEIIKLSSGGGQPNINQEKVASLKITAPDYSHQKTIVSFLDYETARIDQLIAKQQQLIELLKEKRQAVISHAVTKGLNPNAPMKDSGVEWLGQVPEHWGITRLKYECSHIVDCLHSTPTYDDEGEYPAIRTADISLGIMNVVTARRVNISTYQERNIRLKPMPDDIIYSREGERFGMAACVPPNTNVCLGQRVMLFRADNPARFLMWALNSDFCYKQALQDVIGSTSPHINVETIKNFEMAWPPYNERIEIASFIDETTRKINNLTAFAEKKVKLLQERRTALISAAVTGKIDLRGWQPPQREVAA